MNEMILPEISQEKCTACGTCVENCPEEAVTMSAEMPTFTNAEACTYCGICEDLCPEGAIELAYEIQ